MHIRIFARSLASLVVGLLLSQAALAAPKGATVTYTVAPAVIDGSKTAQVWLPYPLSNENQTITGVTVGGNFTASAVYRDAKSSAVFLHAQWSDLKEKPVLTMRFHVTPDFSKGSKLKNSGEPIPADIRSRYLDEAPEGYFRQVAAKITRGRTSVLEKARAAYDWTIDNTFRDPEVKGCGLGLPGRTMTQGKGGGKCADISSVFVALARAAGVPAREVVGLRLAEPKDGEITSDFHCWAEFYLPGHGWVMVDPADVRKMMLVNKLELKDAENRKWREFFWNGDDLFRIVLNKDSREVELTPRQHGEALTYFMYPFGQVDGETLNFFDPKKFSYKVDLTLDR
ncbi:transglutaminase-like domain-containing protein [Fundidesulfovibrio putealis]|uniref:transglutaminase-like domain-containing protein n=1 Tax=Fundidesulfovibrio putealis TaxID=270496 RepID=UPI000404706C|nr:transglutaminase-like domain-containing protein [Fundidesulfovibrio putealis]